MTSDQTDLDCPLGPSYRYGLEEQAHQSLFQVGAARQSCAQDVLVQASFHSQSLLDAPWTFRNDQVRSRTMSSLEFRQSNLHRATLWPRASIGAIHHQSLPTKRLRLRSRHPDGLWISGLKQRQ